MINLEGKRIKYFVKNQYGIDRFYLNDPIEAKNFQRLTKAKTMTPDQMQALMKLTDIQFEEVLPSREIPF